eukprot:GEMP01082768.1.p1 GENE.GEMP01082768.1~~GEMP01082768.1.p1  ORF type:complete len:108 (+),score=42.63 GEMP01082768.1:115-438(+)
MGILKIAALFGIVVVAMGCITEFLDVNDDDHNYDHDIHDDDDDDNSSDNENDGDDKGVENGDIDDDDDDNDDKGDNDDDVGSEFDVDSSTPGSLGAIGRSRKLFSLQ